MLKQLLPGAENFFRRFVARYQSGDSLTNEHISLKTRHTTLVCENSDLITAALNWPENDRLLARVAALFHDIGRFPQIERYHTFNDAVSCDHAVLGVETLLGEKALLAFSPRQQRIILSAVAWHNKRRPPAGLPADEQPFLAVTRDADKLDIFRLLTDYYSVRAIAPDLILELGLPEARGVTDKIARALLNSGTADIKDIQNVNDLRLARLSWIFDLNFDISRQLFHHKNYLEKTVAALPDTPQVAAIARHIADYLAQF